MPADPPPSRPPVVMPSCPPHAVLNGQTAIVTGASSGIGEATAIALAEAGANVVVNFHGREEAARAIVRQIETAGHRAIAHRADVSDETAVREMFTATVAEFGAVEILVNNAGIQQDAAIDAMTLDQWNAVLAVNLTGQFLCAREAVRQFKRQGARPEISAAVGKIICMSSVHERIPWAGHANYAASKGGVNLLMLTLAQELAPMRIRVNGIAPGAIRTAINRESWETPEARDRLNELIPYGRIGDPADIARAVVWLASDYSDYLTGTTLTIDGGMTLYPGFADNG